MKSHTIYKTLLLVIAFALIGVYLYVVLKGADYDYALHLPVIRTHGTDEKSCNNLSGFINSAIQKANYCATDEDCMVSDVGAVPCNCWSLVNTNASTALFTEKFREWQERRCERTVLCEPCNSPSSPQEIACVNSRCVTRDIFTENKVDVSHDTEIRLPLILHPIRESGAHTSARTDADILALFKSTQTIWSQAGIIFEVTLEEAHIQDQTLPTTIGNYPFFRDVVASTNDKALHAYYIRDLAGANGWMVGPRHIAVADVTTVDDFRATAHEIGHLFGLGHAPDNETSLMASGRNGQTLSEEEITRAQKYAAEL
ncbi:MAG: hypothetical protein HY564_03170 [Candidatus Jacksonbacteria bacterium]|nr:hypothetical protein [Candidatus Jacksonbacteria bacterium]